MRLRNSTRVALVDLLKRGQLGPLKLGLTAEVVRELFGPEAGIASRAEGDPNHDPNRILYYGRYACGPLQIYLEDDRVWGIEVDALALPTRFWIRNLPRFELPRTFLSEAYVKRFMTSNRISWTMIDDRDGQVVLKTNCGTRIWFDDGLLMEIQVFETQITNYSEQA